MDGFVKVTEFVRLTEAQMTGAYERWVGEYTWVLKLLKDEE